MRDNKLIAQFMGVRFMSDDKHIKRLKENRDEGIYYDLGYMESELKYHESWDWLMPVIEKIMDISFQEEGDVEDFYSIRDCIPDIGYTYKAVVEFIKEK